MDFPQWLINLDSEDITFIRNFIVASGSLKEMAQQYAVSYPTVRLRLDRLIQKIMLSESGPNDPFIDTIKALAIDEKIDLGTLKTIIKAYKETRGV